MRDLILVAGIGVAVCAGRNEGVLMRLTEFALRFGALALLMPLILVAGSLQ